MNNRERRIRRLPWSRTQRLESTGDRRREVVPDVTGAVMVLQQFVRRHSELASAAVSAGEVDNARRHQLLADVAREAIPAGWSPPPPPWVSPAAILAAIDDGLITAAQFVDSGGGETETLTSLRHQIRRVTERHL